MASASEIWAYASAGATLAESHPRGVDLHLVHGLVQANPLEVTAALRTAGAVAQTITESAGTTIVERAT